MRNKALIFVLIGAIFFGLIAAVSVSRFLSDTQASNLNTIVVAKVEIPIGSKLLPEQLTTVRVPRNTTPDGTFDAPEKVVGRITVTRIATREPITNYRLAGDGVTAGLSAIVPEGYRAMTVRVDDESGLSGFLKPGAIVDVLAVISPPGQNSGDPISKIVLQNIKVLASGENLDDPKDKREAKSVKTVTLQVTPEQAEKLVLASIDGRLRLALRNSVDQGDEQTLGATKRTLLTGERALPIPEPGIGKSEPAAKPASPPRRRPARAALPPIVTKINPPAPPPAAPRLSVEVFEGLKKRTVDFP
jgi:pilus assembly protein CpaB